MFVQKEYAYSSVPNNRVTPINRVKWELKDDMVACKKQMFPINVYRVHQGMWDTLYCEAAASLGFNIFTFFDV